MKLMHWAVFAAGVVFCLAAEGECKSATGRKKIISHNWDMLRASTEDVWRNRGKFAETGFDGVLFPLDRHLANGRTALGRTILGADCYKDDEFARSVSMAGECLRCEGLKESLALFMMIPPRRLPWTDDAAWTRVASNLACFARAAKKAGFRGFAMDHEDYTKQCQFIYREALDPAVDETCRLARRRGRQVFGAFFKECPDAFLLSFWLFSDMRWILRAERQDCAVKVSGNLWISFLNGLLDVIPPSAKIVEGNETTGYAADGDKDLFRALAYEVVRDVLPLVSAENRGKYLGQLSVSFGQYLDAYVVPESNKYHIGDLEGARLRRFARNVSTAAGVADDLVWVYGETGTLVDWDVKHHKWMKYPTWKQKFANLPDVLRAAAGDVEYFSAKAARKEMKRPVFEESGFCGATFTNGESKTLKVACKVTAGDIVYVRLKTKGLNPSLTVQWTREGRGAKVDTGWIAPAGCSNGESWTSAEGVYVVPEGADGLRIVIGAPWSRKSPVGFSDVEVFTMDSAESVFPPAS